MLTNGLEDEDLAIQPHGVVLGVRPGDLAVLQASANAAAWLGDDAVRSGTLTGVFGEADLSQVRGELERLPAEGQAYLGTIRGPDGPLFATAHRNEELLIVELERTGAGEEPAPRGLFPMIRSTRRLLGSGTTVEELSRSAVKEIRELSGFDRVMIFELDESGNRHVIAEDQRGGTISFLNLWFWADDSPEQPGGGARSPAMRVIGDVQAAPVPIVPRRGLLTDQPLDLSFTTWKRVTRREAEYLRKMGSAGWMSIPVVRAGRLWGAIECHHPGTRVAPLEARAACDLAAQAFAAQLSTLEGMAELEHRIQLRAAVSRLLSSVAQEDDLVDGLTKYPDALLGAMRADGAAVLFEGRCTMLGNTPPEQQVMDLGEWLVREGRQDVFHTDRVSELLPAADAVRRNASGLLAVSISQVHRSYLMWFRPEVVQKVRWAGDPTNQAPEQVVRGRSSAWKPAEIEIANELRNSIVGIVLRKAEELAGLSAELKRSNTELEAFSYSVSHDLRAPFRHIAGYAELLREHAGESLDAQGKRYIDTIVESAHSAGELVDHLLSYSRIGRAKLYRGPVNMKRLVAEAIREVETDHKGRSIEWRVGDLPMVHADASMMSVVMRNLLSNAAKYTRGREPAIIEIGAEQNGGEVVFWAKDNGVGFDQKYADKLFGVFQRLHKQEEFEGSGIGLANVRRIIARHGGRTWAEGVPGAGASIWFTLPVAAPEAL